jgi:para-aminobenzoate synthetase component 1
MICRFEDRLNGRALQLQELQYRIEARTPNDVQPAFDAIETARRAGHWVALLLDFELGEWLLATALLAEQKKTPLLPPRLIDATPRPRLRALVFATAHAQTPWRPSAAQSNSRLQVIPRLSREHYLQHVQTLQNKIARGEFYQVNYTMPLAVHLHGDPSNHRAFYTGIAHRHPVAHAAYIEDENETILSFSPELFVARQGNLLTTRPMKGTAPRHPDAKLDDAQGQALLASEKNRAENLMIVDLLRNDLGRLAQPGSVYVPALYTLERYPTLWALTSTITARIPCLALGDILRALFPCGSVTGAPKIAALAHIRRIETTPRGLYCGSIGWLAPNGDFSLNVAIRTLTLNLDGVGVYGTGSGIVHDSDPAAEWQECLLKARILEY